MKTGKGDKEGRDKRKGETKGEIERERERNLTIPSFFHDNKGDLNSHLNLKESEKRTSPAHFSPRPHESPLQLPMAAKKNKPSPWLGNTNGSQANYACRVVWSGTRLRASVLLSPLRR